MSDATVLLKAWQAGDEHSRDELMALLYDDLKRRARGVLRQERCRLQPTELISEAYLRLMDYDRVAWQDRAHFLHLAATVMRQVLLDHYRKQGAAKRSAENVTLVTAHLLPSVDELAVTRLEDALTTLQQETPELAELVQLRFFSGMSVPEIALATNQSESSVKRRWRTARAWLLVELQADGA